MVDITSKNITHELILIFIIYFGIRTADSLDKKEDEDKKNPKISQKERESESESVAILIIIFWVAGIIYLWNIW
jgi:cadmium resistance protein CadD (predicted permease)